MDTLREMLANLEALKGEAMRIKEEAERVCRLNDEIQATVREMQVKK